MPAAQTRALFAVALLTGSALSPITSHAVDVLAVGELDGHDGGPILLPIHDADFGTWVKARVTAEVGKVSGVLPRGGAVELSWTPPEEFAGGPVQFLVRYKDDQGAKQEKSFTLVVPAAASVPISVTAEPAVVAPDVKQVQLRWKAPPSGQDPQSRPFVLAASSGEIGPVEVSEDGTASAVWHRPPGIKTPVMALVTVVDSADSRRRGRVELPIQVSRSTTFQVPSDAKVSVQLGDETIGPKQASPAGTVAFDLRLDPRVREGHLTGRTPHGEEVDQVVDLPEVAAPVVALAVGSSAYVNSEPISVAAAVWSLDDSIVPTLTASSGKLTLADPSDGWLEGTLASDADFEGAVTLTAKVGDAKVKGQVMVVLGVPAVSAVADPPQLKAAQRNVAVSASPIDALQRPVADSVGMVPLDGVFTARPVRRGDSTTAKVLKNRGMDTLVVLTEPPGSVAGEPVAAIVPWLVPIGEERMVLRIAAIAPSGRAIANVPLRVEVHGTAPEGLPTDLKTDGYGLAHASFATPEGALGIQVVGGGRSGGVAIAPDGTPLAGGDAHWLRIQKVWAASAPTVVIDKSAPVAVAAAIPVPADAASPPAAGFTADTETPQPAAGPSTTPKAPKAPKQIDGTVWLRAAVALQGTALNYSSVTEDSSVGPLSATLESAGVTGGGLAAHVLAWPQQGVWGIEADVRYDQATLSPTLAFGTPTLPAEDLEDVEDADDIAALTTPSTSQTFKRNAPDLRLGLRYRATLTGPLAGYGLLQFHRHSADLFLWDSGAVTDANPTLMGARIGGGAMVEAGPVWLDAQIAETLAPYPIRFEAEGRVQANITPAIAIHAGGGMAWRTMVFTIDESDLTVKDQQASFVLGLATTLR